MDRLPVLLFWLLLAIGVVACGTELEPDTGSAAPTELAAEPPAGVLEVAESSPAQSTHSEDRQSIAAEPEIPSSAGLDSDKDQTEWMAMLLNGKKTGYMKLERDIEADRITTRETVSMTLNRGPTTVEIKTVDTSTETRDGQPLAFESRQDISSMAMTISGKVSDGQVVATTNTAGNEQQKKFPWPTDALMPEGLRLATLRHGLEPGTQFKASAFLPSSLQAVDATVRVGASETVDLFGVESELIRVEQTMDLGGGNETTGIAWVTPDYAIKKMRFTIMGMTLETIACPRECALSASEPTEFFVNSFAESPRAVSAVERTSSLTYQISNASNDVDFIIPESDEQDVLALEDNTFVVTISVLGSERPRRKADSISPRDYLGETRWLQSRAAPIVELANRARGDSTNQADTMRNLQDFVREYVDDKNLTVGYASALEVARDRSGDCTEHALLLAALGRALGIPTRVATGLAYVDNWLGAEHIFVPHAWAQALIDDRWISYDAALGRFDAGHIALGYGDGDPFGFYSSVNALGNIRIESITAK